MTESQFQAQILELAALYGWRSAHFGNTIKYVRRGSGYTTIPDKGAAGFPDLVLCRERVVFAELKAVKGRLSIGQRLWLDALQAAGAETYVWRPDDLEQIQRVLGRQLIRGELRRQHEQPVVGGAA